MPIIEGAEGRGDTSALAADAAELHTFAGAVPTPDIALLGTTDDLSVPAAHDATTPLVHHTATSAIAASYLDLAAARTSVNTLRTEVENALAHTDTFIDDWRVELEAALDAVDDAVGTIVTETEARLDDLEAKVDELLGALQDAGIVGAA